MFLNVAMFKRMLKEAYNTRGLIVYNSDPLIALSDGVWTVTTTWNKMSKKEKAAVIELTGEIPETGECVSYSKMGGQQVLKETVIAGLLHFEKEYERAIADYKPTYVLVAMKEKMARAIQSKASNEVRWVDEKYISAIDLKAAKENDDCPGEMRVTDRCLIWRSNDTIYAVGQMDLKNPELTALLENMELYHDS